jgi:hypothetical protein
MAYGDEYTYTDENGKTVTYTVAPSPAQDDEYVAELRGQDRLRIDDANRARAAGVTGVDKIDYAEALHNYETRPDAETLAHRRARENATTFADQDFARYSVTVAEAGDDTIGAGTTRDRDGDNIADGRDSSNNPYQQPTG